MKICLLSLLLGFGLSASAEEFRSYPDHGKENLATFLARASESQLDFDYAEFALGRDAMATSLRDVLSAKFAQERGLIPSCISEHVGSYLLAYSTMGDSLKRIQGRLERRPLGRKGATFDFHFTLTWERAATVTTVCKSQYKIDPF